MGTAGLAADQCVYEGAARNSVTRLPVAKASIHLVPVNAQAGYAGTTDAAGGFHFEGVEAGDYRIEVERAGYTSRASSKLHLAPGQKVDKAELWLTPDSGISGKVLGADGEPLPGARITLIARKWRRGKRVYQGIDSERTDGAGAYHCTGVAPGRYLMYAARPREGPLAYSILEAPGKPEMRIAGRYHPDSAQLEVAAPVEVRAGEEIAGIDFKLPLVPVFHVSGQAAAGSLGGAGGSSGAGSGGDGTGVSLQKRNNDQALEWESEGAFIGKDGSFDIAGVTAGDYFLFSFQSRQSDRWVSPKIPLTVATRDIAGLAAPAIARFDLAGRIRVEDGAAAEAAAEALPVQIFCEGSQDDDYSSFQRRAQPKADGAFVIKDLAADRYAIGMANMETGKEGGFYLKSVRVNGVTAAGDEVDMTAGAAADVELILGSGGGSVEGTVAEPAGDMTVVVIPESVPSGDTRPVAAYLDQDGHFRLTDLEPGSYLAFAVTGYDKGLWQNAEFRRRMAGRGTAFEVAEKGSARIAAAVVPAAEVRQVEEQIP